MDLNDYFSSSSFNNFFNFKYNYSLKGNYDWDELKKIGYVEEQSEEKNGFKTITRTFISKDGETKITTSLSEPLINEKFEKIKLLNEQINEAVSKEDYEKAAKLKKEKESLLNDKK